MTVIRQPAVAGHFYPGNSDDLSVAVRGFLDGAQAAGGAAPKALIAPHAGYVYSGPVAASAYACLEAFRERYRRVILLGPCHRAAFSGLAFSSANLFRTPLGDVPIDDGCVGDLDVPEAMVCDAVHHGEHSLEVHLPFLQSVLDEFSLVPIVVGRAEPRIVARVIDALWGGPETLLVVSSDLSHHRAYDDACVLDRATCTAIEKLRPQSIVASAACGATPVAGLLIAARRRGMQVSTLDLRNSGDTVGNRDKVVGYGAWVLRESQRL